VPWYRSACYSADYDETKRNVLSRILKCVNRCLQHVYMFTTCKITYRRNNFGRSSSCRWWRRLASDIWTTTTSYMHEERECWYRRQKLTLSHLKAVQLQRNANATCNEWRVESQCSLRSKVKGHKSKVKVTK